MLLVLCTICTIMYSMSPLCQILVSHGKSPCCVQGKGTLQNFTVRYMNQPIDPIYSLYLFLFLFKIYKYVMDIIYIMDRILYIFIFFGLYILEILEIQWHLHHIITVPYIGCILISLIIIDYPCDWNILIYPYIVDNDDEDVFAICLFCQVIKFIHVY